MKKSSRNPLFGDTSWSTGIAAEFAVLPMGSLLLSSAKWPQGSHFPFYVAWFKLLIHAFQILVDGFIIQQFYFPAFFQIFIDHLQCNNYRFTLQMVRCFLLCGICRKMSSKIFDFRKLKQHHAAADTMLQWFLLMLIFVGFLKNHWENQADVVYQSMKQTELLICITQKKKMLFRWYQAANRITQEKVLGWYCRDAYLCLSSYQPIIQQIN